MMRLRYWFLILGAISALGGWCGYWVLSRDLIAREPTRAAADLQAMGFEASIAHTQVGGFPSKWIVAVDAPKIAAATARWAWSSARLGAEALVYKTNHVFFFLPDPQEIKTPFGEFTLNAPKMRASMSFHENVLGRVSIEAPNLEASWGEAKLTARRAEAHFRQSSGAEGASARALLTAHLRDFHLIAEDVVFRPTPDAEPLRFSKVFLTGGLGLNGPIGRAPLQLANIEWINIESGGLSGAQAPLDVSPDKDAETLAAPPMMSVRILDGDISLADGVWLGDVQATVAGGRFAVKEARRMGWLGPRGARALTKSFEEDPAPATLSLDETAILLNAVRLHKR